MVKQRRTPQEKKRLSLAKDVVDQWGENQKSFRKKWPRKKALASRARRHVVTRRLSEAPTTTDDVWVPRKPLLKWSGTRLGVAVKGKHERRARLQDDPRKSPDARARRRDRRQARGRSAPH